VRCRSIIQERHARRFNCLPLPLQIDDLNQRLKVLEIAADVLPADWGRRDVTA